MSDQDPVAEEALPYQFTMDIIPESATSGLALELVAGLSAPAKILERHGISPTQFKLIAKTPAFKQLYREANSFWNSDKNAADRIKAKSQMMVEDSLIDIFRIIKDERANPASRLDSFKQLSMLGGVSGTQKQEGGGSGEKFSISINLGDSPAEKVVVDVDVPHIEEDS